MYYDRWQKNHLNEYYGMTKEEIKEKWEAATTEGTKLHAAIEAFYNRDDVDYNIDKPEWKHFLAFQKKFDLAAYRTEMILWSKEHKLGGTVDLVVENGDGTYSIYDWKRTKHKVWKDARHFNKYGSGPLSGVKDNKYYRYSMQLNIYRELLERYYDYKVKSMSVVRFHPNAKTLEVTNVERMETKAAAVLDHRRKSIADTADTADTSDLQKELCNLDIKDRSVSRRRKQNL